MTPFEKMVAKLKADGLLDADHKMTDTGHQYVENLKRDLREKQAKVMAEMVEEIDGHVKVWERSEAA